MTNPLNPDAPLHYIERTDSTMLEARRLVDASRLTQAETPLSGTVVQAGLQSAGRGRLPGRKWEAASGDALLFTVIFTKKDLAARMSGRLFTLLPLLCGLAAAEAVEQFTAGSTGQAEPHDIRIKWPNDVLADGRKLCGILCEASGEWVYTGIGINLNQTAFPEDLRRPACSVRMLTGIQVNSNVGLLELVLERLDAALINSNWRQAIDSRLYMVGETAGIRPGLPEDASEGYADEVISGTIAGIDSTGALIIENDKGRFPVINGELLV